MTSHRTDIAKAARERERSIRRVAGMLERESFPRTLLLGFVTVAGASGFLASAGLLALGFQNPAPRYAFAGLVGYGAFLLSLRLWLGTRREGDASLPEVDLNPIGEIGTRKADTFGGGGGFSGGGSGGRIHAMSGVVDVASASDAKESVLGDAAGLAADADEGIVVLAPILLIVAVLVGVAASLSVVWQAPVLLAEVLVDGALAALVYQRVQARPAAHWTTSVWRRTWKPALAIVVTLAVFGALIPVLVPGADSIGDLFR